MLDPQQDLLDEERGLLLSQPLPLCYEVEQFSSSQPGNIIFHSGAPERQNYSQFYDQNDILLILINLMKIDDVVMLHLGQYVNLLLNIPHGHPTSGAFNPLLLYILCSVLRPVITRCRPADQIGLLSPGRLFYDSVDHSKLPTEINKLASV